MTELRDRSYKRVLRAINVVSFAVIALVTAFRAGYRLGQWDGAHRSAQLWADAFRGELRRSSGRP